MSTTVLLFNHFLVWLGFNSYFWSRCQNSRAVDQTGDKRSSAAAGIRTNTQPSPASRCWMLLQCFLTAGCNHVRFFSLNCAWTSSRSRALYGPQPAGHQIWGWCHRRNHWKSGSVYSTWSPDYSDWRIQEVKTKTCMETDSTVHIKVNIFCSSHSKISIIKEHDSCFNMASLSFDCLWLSSEWNHSKIED